MNEHRRLFATGVGALHVLALAFGQRLCRVAAHEEDELAEGWLVESRHSEAPWVSSAEPIPDPATPLPVTEHVSADVAMPYLLELQRAARAIAELGSRSRVGRWPGGDQLHPACRRQGLAPSLAAVLTVTRRAFAPEAPPWSVRNFA